MQSLQITVFQILWGICSEQRAQVKFEPPGLFGDGCGSVSATLMNHVNHGQLLNNSEGGAGGEGRGEFPFLQRALQLGGNVCVCVSAGTRQLGGHKFPIQILLLQRLSLLPRDSRGNLEEPGLSLPLEALTEGKWGYF